MRNPLQVVVIALICFAISGCGETQQPAPPGADSPRLSALLRADPAAGFALADAPRRFEFPADHAAHPAFRNEWWYLTGNLDDDDGHRFGYELTLFRFALAPPGPSATAPADRSAWRTRQAFIGHFAVTDVAARRFRVVERSSRGALGLAGALGPPVRVWLEDWSLQQHGADGWRVRAKAGGFAIALDLESLAPPVLNGDAGLSRKSAEPGNANYYYSIPRLQTAGSVTVGEGRQAASHAVTGLSWMDREWGSLGLAATQQGWDWFALQLDDGSSLMLYRLRRSDGSLDPASGGTWMPADGPAVTLDHAAASVTVRDYWNSPGGGRYPSSWTIALRGEALELAVEPVLDDQELDTRVRYWEGAVDARGRLSGQPVRGRGYVELTGYADSS